MNEFCTEFLPLITGVCDAMNALKHRMETIAGDKRTHPLSDPETRTSKRVKKEKDPNAPKRPMTSYLLFCRDNRQRISDALSHELGNEQTVQSALSAEWKTLDAEAKAVRLSYKVHTRNTMESIK